MSAAREESGSSIGSWVLYGLLGGLIAGLVFLVFEMVFAGIAGPSPFGPPRMISAIALGQGALPPQPAIGINTALPVALVVHFINSAVFGAIFGAIVGLVGALRGSRGILIGAATVFGLVLWIVNFYVIAPIAFPWFQSAAVPVQFVAHTFFFGTALGLLLVPRLSGKE